MGANDLARSTEGRRVFHQPEQANVGYILPDGRRMKIVQNVTRPNGISLRPDDDLDVNDSRGEYLLAYE